jgi:predicted DNA-binding transcriptional regulator AlpA
MPKQKESKTAQLADRLEEIHLERKKGQCGIPKGFIGIREMCELFGRSRTSIYQMIGAGLLPESLRIGKTRIWDKKEMLNHLKHAKFAK